MYLLIIMAIRPDALPTDLAALTEMVLALDAENEKLRVAMQTLKEMMFGKRSERLAALVAEQLALELDDLETGVTPPAPANDCAFDIFSEYDLWRCLRFAPSQDHRNADAQCLQSARRSKCSSPKFALCPRALPRRFEFGT